ncbi:MAG: sialidase family protein, partial [Mycobacteriales bacterium]
LGLVVAGQQATTPAGAQPAGRPAAAAADRAAARTQPLGSGPQLYPRLIRLQHSGAANGQLIASTVTFDPQGYGAIWRSTNDGASFTQIGAARDPASATGDCCGSIYELPVRVGAFPAGTLLYSASYGQGSGGPKQMRIDLLASTDHGDSWSVVSTVVAEPAPTTAGLWEPEMRVDSAGRLNVYYSDETDPAHSQKLVRRVSSDGLTWSATQDVVALPDAGARPGMAVVRTIADGTELMTYEVCGSTYGCDVYFRTSSGGIDWGDPAAAGTRIVATDGTRFQHTPDFTVVEHGPLTGRIVLAGQLYVNPDGSPNEGNGTTLLVNSTGGTGAWTRATAPVAVPNAYNNYCPNYSPALAATADGHRVIEISTMYDGNTCVARFGTGRI